MRWMKETAIKLHASHILAIDFEVAHLVTTEIRFHLIFNAGKARQMQTHIQS